MLASAKLKTRNVWRTGIEGHPLFAGRAGAGQARAWSHLQLATCESQTPRTGSEGFPRPTARHVDGLCRGDSFECPLSHTGGRNPGQAWRAIRPFIGPACPFTEPMPTEGFHVLDVGDS